jgi:hypothetical protein
MNDILDNIIAKSIKLIGDNTDDPDEILELLEKRRKRSPKQHYYFYDDFGDFSNDTYLYDNDTYF